ncbi:MAG: ABC transporter permease [Theionarchaea archaeon]|nr:ABC transporter permease [Theionarchaea archaeon]
MIEYIQVIWSSLILQLKRQRANKFFWFMVTVQPMIFATVGFILFQGSEEENFLLYVVLGVGMMSIWSMSLFASGISILIERFLGTLEVLFGSPAPFEFVMLGKGLANACFGLIGLGVAILYSWAVLHIPLQLASPGFFFCALLLTIFSLTCLGVILATFFTLARAVQAFVNLLEYPIIILSGLMFPLSLLPQWTYPFSMILSPTWGIQALRKAALGNTEGIWLDIGAICILSLVYLVIAYILVHKMDSHARKTGQLVYY